MKKTYITLYENNLTSLYLVIEIAYAETLYRKRLIKLFTQTRPREFDSPLEIPGIQDLRVPKSAHRQLQQ